MSWELSATTPDDQRWLDLLQDYDHLLFHEPVWSSVMKAGLGAEPMCLLLSQNGTVCGGLVGFSYRVLWAKLVYLNLPYGGPIGQIPAADELSFLLTKWARQANASRIRIATSPGLPDLLAGYASSQLQLLPQSTHVCRFNGRDFDTLWTGFKGRVRRDVRKAEKSGVTVASVFDDCGIDSFYELYTESMRRNRTVHKYSRAYVAECVAQLAHARRGTLLLASRDGRPVAGMLLADSDNGTHYLMAGSLSEELKYCPNDLLLSHAIRRAIDLGREYFDFLPSGDDNCGLEQFKAKWDAEKVEIPVYEIVTSPLSMLGFNTAFKVATSEVGRRLAYTKLGRNAIQSLRPSKERHD